MLKRILSFLMAVIMLCSVGIIANAETPENLEGEQVIAAQIGDGEVQPLYSYTSDVYVGLSVSNGTATCTTKVTGYSGTTTKIAIKMTLQKKALIWWTDQGPWSSTTNGYTATLSKKASVGSGTYRVKAEITVYSGTKSETITKYSQEVKA